MGPHVDSWPRWSDPKSVPTMTLRPFAGSTTHQNLMAGSPAVIHFSDDPWLFAKSATSPIRGDEVESLTVPLGDGCRRLERCQRYFRVRCRNVRPDDLRPVFACEVLEHAVVDPGGPLHRGTAAVIEAAILATRVHLNPPHELERSIQWLRSAVDKTADERTTDAFALIETFIDAARSTPAAPK